MERLDSFYIFNLKLCFSAKWKKSVCMCVWGGYWYPLPCQTEPWHSQNSQEKKNWRKICRQFKCHLNCQKILALLFYYDNGSFYALYPDPHISREEEQNIHEGQEPKIMQVLSANVDSFCVFLLLLRIFCLWKTTFLFVLGCNTNWIVRWDVVGTSFYLKVINQRSGMGCVW